MAVQVTFVDVPTDPEDRYARQRLLPWWDQERLANARVVVVGAGALGNEALKLLALVGVGSIVVIDFDTVSPSNLSRTVLFREGDIGHSKAQIAASRARELNPEIGVVAIDGDIERDLGLGVLQRADVVLAGLDNIDARRILNRRCLSAGVVWLNAGISATEGQVTRYVPGRGACYQCTLSENMARRSRERYSCTGLVKRVPDTAVPTTAVGASVVAALQVHDALRFLHDPATGLAPGHRLTVLLDAHRQFVDELPVDPVCAAHVDPVVVTNRLDLPAAECTPAMVAAAVREHVVGELWVELEFDLVEAFSCQDCGRSETVCRPIRTVYEETEICPSCHGKRRAHITTMVHEGSPAWHRPLAELGIADHEILCVVGAGGERHGVEIGGRDLWAEARRRT